MATAQEAQHPSEAAPKEATDAAPILFDAFISYRRADGSDVANWLRRELEDFRPPARLAHLGRAKLRVYLDTAYERGTNDFYANSIRPALLASRHLIVIATPAAELRANSAADWMQREVDDFASGPNADNIMVVRGAGDFDGPLPADLTGRFPNLEIVDLRGATRLSFLSPARAARLAGEKLKLLAPLLDVAPADMPALRMEEERKQQRRLGAVAGVAFGVVAMVAAASMFAFQSLGRAQTALRDSIFAAERLIAAVGREVPQGSDPYGLRGTLLNEACDLKTSLEAEALRPPALAEHVVCELERARGHEAQQEPDAARQIIVRLLQTARSRDAAEPSVGSAMARIRTEQALLDFDLRQHDVRADAGQQHLATTVAQLTQRHAKEPDFLDTLAWHTTGRASAERDLGNAAAEADDRIAAAAHWRQAVSLLASVRFGSAERDEQRQQIQADTVELQIAIAAHEYALGHRTERDKAQAEVERLLESLRRAPNLSGDLRARLARLESKLGELPGAGAPGHSSK